jgi:small subunit ribosomal protein S16
MAVRIRLMRMGSKRRPFYRFVVTDSRGKRDGGFLDQVGFYNPIEKPLKIEVDEEKVFDWMAKGAVLSDGAKSLLRKTGTLARWDAKRTGREAPAKTLATAEVEAAVAPKPAGEESGETAEAATEAAPETAPEAASAEEAPEEAAGEEVPQGEAPSEEPPSEEPPGDLPSEGEEPKEA